MGSVATKRIYDPAGLEDGCRVLVDRLWPRGISREGARLDRWLPEVAPSSELRKWFAHDVDRWPEFQRRYQRELQASAALDELYELARVSEVTLLFGAKDRDHNQAIVLRDMIVRTVDGPDRAR